MGFLDWFKQKTGRATAQTPQTPGLHPTAVKPPEAENKVVMPQTVKPVNLAKPAAVAKAPGSPAAKVAPSTPPPVPAATPTAKPAAAPSAAAAAVPKTIPFPGATAKAPAPAKAPLPAKAPAPAKAPLPTTPPAAAPKPAIAAKPAAPAKPAPAQKPAAAKAPAIPDKEITFALSDFSDALPEGALKNSSAAPDTVVKLPSTSVASTLSLGKASIKLADLAGACPDLIQVPAGEDADALVNLPLSKLVQQLGSFGSRPDQLEQEQPEEQFETPFLKGAIDDGAKLEDLAGKKKDPTEPLAAAPKAPAKESEPEKPAAPKAKPAAKAPTGAPADATGGDLRRPPATVRSSVASDKVSVPEKKEEKPATPAPIAAKPKTAPAPIKMPKPITATPKAPGKPAVPAKPEVPAAVAKASPKPLAAAKAAPAPAASGGATIALGLGSIIRNLPMEYVEGDLDSISNDIKIELPLAPILEQLPQGRVSVLVDTLTALLPDRYRNLLSTSDSDAEVPLPLPEIMANLPSEALSTRTDQAKDETLEEIPTPFSQKMKEDAARFKGTDEKSGAEEAKPSKPDAPKAKVARVKPAKAKPAKAKAAKAKPVKAEAAKAEAAKAEAAKAEAAKAEAAKAEAAKAEAAKAEAAKAEAAKAEAAKAEAAKAEAAKAEAAKAEAAKAEAAKAEAAKAEAAKAELPKPPAFPPTKLPMPAPKAVAGEPAKPEAPLASADEPLPPAPIPTSSVPAEPWMPDMSPDQAMRELQDLFMTDEPLDARRVTRLTSELPSIGSVITVTDDGLKLAGELTTAAAPDALAALTPQFINRAAKFAGESGVGQLQSLTLESTEGLVTFFQRGNICLVVLHDGRDLRPGIRGRLAKIITALAAMYPPASH